MSLFNSGIFVSNNLLFNRELIERIFFRLRKITDDNKVHMEEYLSKTDAYNLPYCIKFKLIIKGQEYLSWGNGKTKDEATFKAIAELIERLFYTFSTSHQYKQFGFFGKKNIDTTTIEQNYPKAENWLGKTTSGVAIHSSLSQARTAAINELIERHVILKAHALCIPPFKVNNPKCLERYTIPKKAELNFYIWQGPLKTYVSVCHIKDSYGQTMYSFGAHKKKDKACEKAFFESTGMIIASEQNKGKIQTPSSRSTPMDQVRDYHLNKKKSEFLSLLSKSSNTILPVDTHIKKKDIYWSMISSPDILGDVSPIIAVRAISPVMQPLFYDKWSSKVINPAAIELEQESYPKDFHVVV